MLRSNSHTHCIFCDGKNTAEEVVQAALARGFHDIGFSSHSDIGLNDPVKLEGYLKEMARLKQVYADQIHISAGVEQDYLYPVKNREDFDYLISSVHYVIGPDGNQWIVDSRDSFVEGLAGPFGGDMMAFIKVFYEMTVESVFKYHPDIVGHLDLVQKYNVDNCYFDGNSKEYLNMALTAAEAILPTGAIFEVNTGGMYRYHRPMPYPDTPILTYMKDHNARLMINSDSHVVESLDYKFPEMLELLKTVGFKSLWLLENGKFVEKGLCDIIKA